MLDQQLRYGIYTARVAKRGLRAPMALRRLRGLRPRTVRQLFISAVAPVVNYASPLWSQGHTTRMESMADQVQRIAATTIIAASDRSRYQSPRRTQLLTQPGIIG